jgi:hypothetical protein
MKISSATSPNPGTISITDNGNISISSDSLPAVTSSVQILEPNEWVAVSVYLDETTSTVKGFLGKLEVVSGSG